MNDLPRMPSSPHRPEPEPVNSEYHFACPCGRRFVLPECATLSCLACRRLLVLEWRSE